MRRVGSSSSVDTYDETVKGITPWLKRAEENYRRLEPLRQEHTKRGTPERSLCDRVANVAMNIIVGGGLLASGIFALTTVSANADTNTALQAGVMITAGVLILLA